MAILLIEKGKGEVVTAPVIRGEIGGGRVQISGRMSPQSKPATPPCCCVPARWQRRWISSRNAPSAPAWAPKTSAKGFHSTLWGFTRHRRVHVSATTCCSVASRSLALVGQPAAADCPALAAAGHADPARHRRHRTDARYGHRLQRADQRTGAGRAAQRQQRRRPPSSAGYDRAWDTILDSNITTLIAGIALLVFGSGPVRGFAVVHCLGILTSMFSAILVSRMLINFIYGRRRKVESLSIGQVWKPDTK
jgi:preprotein translocase subunit SecD